MRTLALSLAAGILMAGCCSVTVSQESGHDVVSIENSRWMLFSILPLGSGDPEYPNQEVTVWFTDSLMLDVNMMLLDDAMKRYDYHNFTNITTYRTDENIIPFLVKRNILHTSAELSR